MSKLGYTFYITWGDPQNPCWIAPIIDSHGKIIERLDGSNLEEVRQKVILRRFALGIKHLITIEDPYNDQSFHRILLRGDPMSIASFRALNILKNDPPLGEPVWRETRLSVD